VLDLWPEPGLEFWSEPEPEPELRLVAALTFVVRLQTAALVLVPVFVSAEEY